MKIAGRLVALGLFSIVVNFTASAAQAADPAEAESAPAAGPSNILDEVVVSAARKRNEDVQSTPLAVTALNAEMLERANVTNLTDVGALAPNLQIETTYATADAVTIYLRGFGVRTNDPSDDPHVATFVDGIYQPQVSGTLIDMFDISQVEVMGGPQGTLLGRNAPVGAVYVTSAKPTSDFNGEVEADYGRFYHSGLRAKVNGSLLSDASGDSILNAKLSLVSKEGGSWIADAATGNRDYGGEFVKGGRLALDFTPTANFDWDLITSFLDVRNPQVAIRNVSYVGGIPGTQSSAAQPAPLDCAVFYAGKCPMTPYGESAIGATQRSDGQTLEVASTMTYHLPAVTLTAVSGYYSYWSVLTSDVGGLPFNALTAYGDRTTSDQESQEIRISSNKGGGWDMNGLLDWVAGLYAANYGFSFDNDLAIFTPAPNVYQLEHGQAKNEALFGHLIYHITDQLSASVGLRQSFDQKEHGYMPPGYTTMFYDPHADFHNTSAETGVQYQIDANRMVYARFAQGYQAGGFLGFPGCPHCGSTYQPEKNNSGEVGFKSDWLEKRLRFNIDYFLNKISDLQIQGVIPSPLPPGYLQSTTNAGKATVQGVETQIIAVPINSFTTRLSVGYLHPKYDEYQSTVCSNVPGVVTDCSGLPFPFAPKLTLNLGSDYVLDLPNNWGTATLSADWNYKSAMYLSDPPFPDSRQSGYGLVNAKLKFTDHSGKYSLAFYDTNLLDKKYVVEWSDSGGLTAGEVDGRPTEWGVQLTAKFGK